MTDLTVDSTAREMVAAIASREISCAELMDLHLARIAERNPQLNAIVYLDEERARDGASEADRTPYDERGPLHGLPWAFKDTHEVAGWRTTYGSPLYADHVPQRDELIVERIRRAGAVPIGKTNVPEFAAGSHTFNTIFGTTLNPVDPTRSAGGSSGGAACALAAGMVPLADGSDMGGSLRNPASFCGVVGLRPQPGPGARVAKRQPVGDHSVGGPMARNVGDVALLLSVLAGPDPRAPLALGEPGAAFAPPLVGTLAGLRVALSARTSAARSRSTPRWRRSSRTPARDGGRRCPRLAGQPDLTLAEETFRTLRAWHFQARFGTLLDEHPDEFKPSLADNIRAGEPLTGADVARAYRQRTALGGDDARASSASTTCWCCRPARCRPSRPTRSTPRRSTASRWRPTWTGCGRRTSSPSPAARPSRCRPAPP